MKIKYIENIYVGVNSLMYAGSGARLMVVKMLLENNANVEAKDDKGVYKNM